MQAQLRGKVHRRCNDHGGGSGKEVRILILMSEQHFTAACAFYLALASQMRRSGHIKVATHADKQYHSYRNRLHAKMQLEGSYPLSAAHS